MECDQRYGFKCGKRYPKYCIFRLEQHFFHDFNNYYQNDNSRTVNQTNNSPKALSRLEIYRMTKNVVEM